MSVYYARQIPKIYPQGLYEESATQKLPLGTKWTLADGREFVYAKQAATGGVTGPGYIAQCAAVDAQQSSCTVQAAAAIGDTTIYVTNGADTHDANTYAEGYVIIEDDAGEGQCLKIRSHDALTSGGTITIVLYDALRVAITTDTTCTIMKHPLDSVIVCPANTPTAPVAGVSPITPTASYYFWLQVRGMAAVLVDNSTTLIVGVPVQAYGDVAGACQVMTENEEIPIIGHCFDIGAQNEKASILLDIKGF